MVEDTTVDRLTFAGGATRSFGRNELSLELGQAGLEQTQMASCGLVLLRPGHLKERGR